MLGTRVSIRISEQLIRYTRKRPKSASEFIVIGVGRPIVRARSPRRLDMQSWINDRIDRTAYDSPLDLRLIAGSYLYQ